MVAGNVQLYWVKEGGLGIGKGRGSGCRLGCSTSFAAHGSCTGHMLLLLLLTCRRLRTGRPSGRPRRSQPRCVGGEFLARVRVMAELLPLTSAPTCT